VKQIFLNLFVNAAQAMEKNGQLLVKTSTEKRGEKRFLQIEVGDSGGGIPQEDLENIFNLLHHQTGRDRSGSHHHKIITRGGGSKSSTIRGWERPRHPGFPASG
jgi:signal transduction histidine kinase